MISCPNLRSLFGSKYRVRIADEHKQQSGIPVEEKPWYYEICCTAAAKAAIVPWGPDRLAVVRDVTGFGNKNGLLLALSSAKLEQDGDDGVTISFDLDQLKHVVKIIRPIRRRKLSPEQASRLKQIGFKKGRK